MMDGMMTTRQLPPNVSAVRDRHGRTRWRWRKAGHKGGYLPGEPWSAEWLAELARLTSQAAQAPAPIQSPRQVKPRSVDELAARLRQSPAWQRQADRTKYVYAGIIDRLLEQRNAKGERFGNRMVANITTLSLDKMLGRMKDKPSAANNLRKVMIRLFKYACKIGWRSDNPASLTDRFAEGKGFHTWTDDEIAQYRAHHANGTMARLVLEVALNSAARRCNIAGITHDMMRGGRIRMAHAKDGEATSVPILPETHAALAAMPTRHISHVIHTSRGKPYSVEGLGNAMKKWSTQAGLTGCSMHGIRKATSRRLAGGGATDAQGRGITGHKKDSTFAYYAAAANREHLADVALSNLETQKFDQP